MKYIKKKRKEKEKEIEQFEDSLEFLKSNYRMR